MTLSDQTQRDLKSILETLDQRLHELSDGVGGDNAPAPIAAAEVGALQALRDSAAGMLRAG